jgi:hypothetical protein
VPEGEEKISPQMNAEEHRGLLDQGKEEESPQMDAVEHRGFFDQGKEEDSPQRTQRCTEGHRGFFDENKERVKYFGLPILVLRRPEGATK